MSALIKVNDVSFKADDSIIFFKIIEEKYFVFLLKDDKFFKVLCYESFLIFYSEYLKKEELDLFDLLKEKKLLKEI